MGRLGELLTTARLVGPEQVEHALRAQVVWGGRLGTNLVELGAIDLEQLGRALGRQHHMAAALARHFDKADPEFQARLPVEVAREHTVVPLLFIKKEKKVAIAALGPLPEQAMAQIADVYGCKASDLLVAVTPELRIRYHLERVYGIARGSRFLRTRKSSKPFPTFDNIPVPVDSDGDLAVPIVVDETAHPTGRAAVPEPINVDEVSAIIEEAVEAAAAREPTQPIGSERRTYVRTLGDDEPAREQTLARIALRRVAVPASGTSLLDALPAIRGGPNRDRVADLVIETLDKHVPSCAAALLLVIRGDVAISWKHFSPTAPRPPELAVALEEPGLVPTVVERCTTMRCAAAQLGAIDRQLMFALGQADGDLVVVPLVVAGRVVALVAIVTEPDAAVDGVEAVVGAAAVAFARLMRDAGR